MRLNTKIILLIVTVTLGVGLSSSFLVSRIMHKALESELHNQAMVIARVVADHVAHNVINGEVIEAHKAVKKVVEHSQSIQYAYIIDFDGRIVTHSFDDGFPKVLVPAPHKLKPKSAQFLEMVHLKTNTGRVLDVGVGYPLIEGMDTYVHIGMDEERMYAQIVSLRNGIIGWTLLLVAVCIATGIFLSRRIMRPLTDLTTAMHDFGEGKEGGELECRSGGWEMTNLTRTFNRMISERKRAEEIVRDISIGVSTQIGEAFFKSLVVHLSKIFKVEYTFIGLLDEQRPDMVNTVSLCVHGGIVSNQSYELANTPCKHVVAGNCDELQTYPRDIQRLFPDDYMLVEMGAQSYIGAPLADSNGKPIGLIVVMDNKPMENTKQVEAILRIFAARASAEMERLRADKASRKSQNMMQLILDSIPVRVFWKDLDLVYLGCNQRFAKDAGLESPEQIIGKNDFELSWPQQAELYRSDDREVMQSGVSKLNYEEPQTWPDGTQLWLQTSKVPLKDLDGNIFGVMGVYEDITERKRSEERETSLGRILDGSLNEIYIFDADTLRFIQVNRGAMVNLGYSIEELRRFTPLDFKPEFTRTSFEKMLAPLRNGDKEKIQFNTVHQRKDGSLYSVEVHLQLSTFESTPAFVAIILDITKRKQAEEALRRSQKMEAIGQLSGGIAHDFNNQLGVIIGYLDFLQDYAANDEKPRKWVDIGMALS